MLLDASEVLLGLAVVGFVTSVPVFIGTVAVLLLGTRPRSGGRRHL